MIELNLTPAQGDWLEASWTDVTQAPDTITPAVPDEVIPATPDELDENGFMVTPGQPEQINLGTPEITTPGAIKRTELKFTSYHPTQLDLLKADALAMGTALTERDGMLTAWVAAYVPPPPEPTPVPQVLTMRQARLVLLAAGLLDDVEAAVAVADRATQIEFEYATEMRRDWPTLIAMATALGMTDAQLDGLFIQGAAL